MKRLLRVLLSASGVWCAAVAVRAQTAELPPIFAPRPVERARAPAPAAPVAHSHLSDRVRTLVKSASERVLAQAKPFELKPAGSGAVAETANGFPATVLMPQYVVKSTALSRLQVERPELPLLRPNVLEREDRRVINGYTLTFWRSRDGNREAFLNVIDFAGQGIDHASDFGRVELGFKIKF